MQSRDNTSAMTRNNQERYGRACIFHISEVVEAKDIVRCTDVLLAQSKDKEVQKENLPNQMTAIRHSSDRTDRATSTGELECTLWSCHLEAFVQRIFFDCTVPSACVDAVAINRPTGTHAPRRYTCGWMDNSDGRRYSLIPDADGAFDGGVEESCG